MEKDKLSLSWNGTLAIIRQEEINEEMLDSKRKEVKERKRGLTLRKEDKVAGDNELAVLG